MIQLGQNQEGNKIDEVYQAVSEEPKEENLSEPRWFNSWESSTGMGQYS